MLLVEDDHGDAFLVSELLREEGAPVEVRRAQSLAEGLGLLAAETFDCVLLDLGLPDASGLMALERLREAAPHVAHLVLTGDRDDQRGIDAVAAGAQDYIVKGSLDGDGLRRAIVYAVERRQADSVRQQLRAAEILAEEATRLERGLLPVPILNDAALLVGTGYRPGRERTLLGGDFYDLIHTPDGAVHLMIGDVSGHGADEAALGVCLRVAWRTQTLGEVDVDRVLPTLQQVLVHERHGEEIFATVSTVTITPDRASAAVRSAGHPPPVLLGDGDAPTSGRRRPDHHSECSTRRAGPRASWRCRRAGVCCSSPTGSSRVAPRWATAAGWGWTGSSRCSTSGRGRPGPRRPRRSWPVSSTTSWNATVERRSTTSPPCS